MAIKTFTTGKIDVNGTSLASLENGGINITLEAGEVTSIGDTWRKIVGLGKSWTITETVKSNPLDSAQAACRTEFTTGNGKITSLEAYFDATNYCSGSCYLTGFVFTKSTGAVDTVALTFEGTGAIHYT